MSTRRVVTVPEPDIAEDSGEPGSWKELHEVVVEHHGVYRIGMETLREIGGFGRLGINVRRVLSSHLASVGLGHLPADLPAYQHEQVILYQYGTPAANVIAAILEGPSDDAETALLRLNSSDDLQRVKDASAKALELLTILSDRCRSCTRPLM